MEKRRSGEGCEDACRNVSAKLGNKIGEADTFIAAMERGRVVFSKDLIDRLSIALRAAGLLGHGTVLGVGQR